MNVRIEADCLLNLFWRLLELTLYAENFHLTLLHCYYEIPFLLRKTLVIDYKNELNTFLFLKNICNYLQFFFSYSSV